MDQLKHILVVDDNSEIRDLLAKYLGQHGYRVSTANGGRQMRQLLESGSADLIILDVMMPEEDGLSICRSLKDAGGPPVIMLTALGEEADTIVGLEMGADDYVSKPFSPRELLARVKAVLRRVDTLSVSKPEVISTGKRKFAGWVLDMNQQQLEKSDGLIVPLSTAEYRLLDVFLSNPRKVLSRDQLLDMTKGREALPFDRSIDNQVSRLRKKIEADPKNPTLIKTVWGGGYSFTAEVESL
ncbi:DNA-binding response regulator [Endozoicomonas sp. OPT23]|uniref:response regulator n=1 Tax=Endozoicomonas sp. OPT23 TaxID=2072845 RepID=UPI00129AE14D|nr:response regulator [Endozoicomonas sp. OPT23]MRI32756.1 DNA-binding response regulator [Endozoicomonas sp. OPT23]